MKDFEDAINDYRRVLAITRNYGLTHRDFQSKKVKKKYNFRKVYIKFYIPKKTCPVKIYDIVIYKDILVTA